jgi:two-component system chemotaxis response regulator CheB
MPISVLNAMETDYCIPLHQMKDALAEIESQPTNDVEIPEDLIRESDIALQVATRIDDVSALGSKSLFTCPDCGGGLWEIQDKGLTRYRCHTGHAYNQQDLEIKQEENIEATLWIAIRMMEERRNLLLAIAEKHRKKGFLNIAQMNTSNALEIENHIKRLREVLFQAQDDKKD